MLFQFDIFIFDYTVSLKVHVWIGPSIVPFNAHSFNSQIVLWKLSCFKISKKPQFAFVEDSDVNTSSDVFSSTETLPKAEQVSSLLLLHVPTQAYQVLVHQCTTYRGHYQCTLIVSIISRPFQIQISHNALFSIP